MLVFLLLAPAFFSLSSSHRSEERKRGKVGERKRTIAGERKEAITVFFFLPLNKRLSSVPFWPHGITTNSPTFVPLSLSKVRIVSHLIGKHLGGRKKGGSAELSAPELKFQFFSRRGNSFLQDLPSRLAFHALAHSTPIEESKQNLFFIPIPGQRRGEDFGLWRHPIPISSESQNTIGKEGDGEREEMKEEEEECCRSLQKRGSFSLLRDRAARTRDKPA